MRDALKTSILVSLINAPIAWESSVTSAGQMAVTSVQTAKKSSEMTKKVELTEDTVCICCAYDLRSVLSGILDMCPRRYMSNHTDEMRMEVAAVLIEGGWEEDQAYDREVHMKAIQQAKENLNAER